MRTDFLDYPTAWAIQEEVGASLDHDPRCSFVSPAGGPMFLCDCSAIRSEWERRCVHNDGPVERENGT